MIKPQIKMGDERKSDDAKTGDEIETSKNNETQIRWRMKENQTKKKK